MFLISSLHVQTVPDSAPHVQSVKSFTAHVQTLPSCTAHVQSVPFYRSISRQYWILKAYVKTIFHLYSQCPVCILSLNPKSKQHSNVYSPCPAFTPSLQSTLREYFISTAQTKREHRFCSTSTTHV